MSEPENITGPENAEQKDIEKNTAGTSAPVNSLSEMESVQPVDHVIKAEDAAAPASETGGLEENVDKRSAELNSTPLTSPIQAESVHTGDNLTTTDETRPTDSEAKIEVENPQPENSERDLPLVTSPTRTESDHASDNLIKTDQTTLIEPAARISMPDLPAEKSRKAVSLFSVALVIASLVVLGVPLFATVLDLRSAIPSLAAVVAVTILSLPTTIAVMRGCKTAKVIFANIGMFVLIYAVGFGILVSGGEANITKTFPPVGIACGGLLVVSWITALVMAIISKRARDPVRANLRTGLRLSLFTVCLAGLTWALGHSNTLLAIMAPAAVVVQSMLCWHWYATNYKIHQLVSAKPHRKRPVGKLEAFLGSMLATDALAPLGPLALSGLGVSLIYGYATSNGTISRPNEFIGLLVGSLSLLFLALFGYCAFAAWVCYRLSASIDEVGSNAPDSPEKYRLLRRLAPGAGFVAMNLYGPMALGGGAFSDCLGCIVMWRALAFALAYFLTARLIDQRLPPVADTLPIEQERSAIGDSPFP